jgi:methylmalonyl-CoA/ethylmalonyl-CoA epimerase
MDGVRVTRGALGRIDHLGIAVSDLDGMLVVYEEAMGLLVHHREVLEDQGVEAAALQVGESMIELLRPLREDSPVGRFLAERGPGIHHVAYSVDDIEATLARLRRTGVRLIDQEPRVGLGGTRIAFVHPKGVGGVLTELVESLPDSSAKRE